MSEKKSFFRNRITDSILRRTGNFGLNGRAVFSNGRRPPSLTLGARASTWVTSVRLPSPPTCLAPTASRATPATWRELTSQRRRRQRDGGGVAARSGALAESSCDRARWMDRPIHPSISIYLSIRLRMMRRTSGNTRPSRKSPA